jgi:hypothetical protein
VLKPRVQFNVNVKLPKFFATRNQNTFAESTTHISFIARAVFFEAAAVDADDGSNGQVADSRARQRL